MWAGYIIIHTPKHGYVYSSKCNLLFPHFSLCKTLWASPQNVWKWYEYFNIYIKWTQKCNWNVFSIYFIYDLIFVSPDHIVKAHKETVRYKSEWGFSHYYSLVHIFSNFFFLLWIQLYLLREYKYWHQIKVWSENPQYSRNLFHYFNWSF